MTCAQFQELVGAYAIGALEPAEKAACDEHLASAQPHHGCWDALRLANEAATLVALSVPSAEPTRAMWEAIESRLDRVAAPKPRARASWAPWMVAAAAVALLVFVARDRMRLEDQLAAASGDSLRVTTAKAACVADLDKARADATMQQKALDLLQRTGTKLVAMAPQGGVTQTANVIFAPTTLQAYVVGHDLAAPTGKDYELWLIRGDKKIAAGLLHGSSAGGALLAQIDPRLLGDGPPDAIAVTLENAGGAPQPAGPIVLVGKI